MTFLGGLNVLMIESQQARIVQRAIRTADLTRDVPVMLARRGDHDVLRGTPVLHFASKPIACLPCDYALRSASTSTKQHRRSHG